CHFAFQFLHSSCLFAGPLAKEKPLLFSFNLSTRSSSSFFSSSTCLSLFSQLSCFSARSFVNFSSSSFFSLLHLFGFNSQLRCFSARSFVNFSSIPPSPPSI
ncbi:hypothetical protein FQN60_015417, partial [Etheostoma spectabile]